MLQKLSHVTVWVLDQDRAHDFYTEKLGFEVRTDQRLGGFRWLTVGPKGQRDLELVLLPVAPGPMLDADGAEALRDLVGKGALCVGILETDDCKATYEELSRKGVVFHSSPQQRPYGIEAVLRDDSGNYFSVVQRPR
jgi:catechol 2,3-dioxygenase-like lactoylglutathione lyase family enzyme